MAVLHHGDAVCDLRDNREIVRDKQHRQVMRAAKAVE
jgi:hypothetical protein